MQESRSSERNQDPDRINLDPPRTASVYASVEFLSLRPMLSLAVALGIASLTAGLAVIFAIVVDRRSPPFQIPGK